MLIMILGKSSGTEIGSPWTDFTKKDTHIDFCVQYNSL